MEQTEFHKIRKVTLNQKRGISNQARAPIYNIRLNTEFEHKNQDIEMNLEGDDQED